MVIDFNKISDGLTRAKSRNPNLHTLNQKQIKNQHKLTKQSNNLNQPYLTFKQYPCSLFLILPSGAFSKPIQALFIYNKNKPTKKTQHFKYTLKLMRARIKNIKSGVFNIYNIERKENKTKGNTLLEMKSTRSSALALRGLELDDIFFQSSLTVEGALAAVDSDADWSMDLLKHQLFPLIGNTTNLALMMMIFLVLLLSVYASI